jgi:uncharacterized damage-inducible protein DinB
MSHHRQPSSAIARRSATALIAVLVLAGLSAGPARAQEGAMESGPGPEILEVVRSDWDSVSDKLVSLAEAIPEDAYGWAPSEEVRSVGEVIVHVTGTNHALTQVFPEAGESPLEGLGESPSKEELLAALKESIARVDQVLAGFTVADLGTTYEPFGREMSGYRILTILTAHFHEHLGQLIAYARSNEVVPPWSS